MGLQQFERRLERLVEGAFAKAFRSGLQPVELGRRLSREMDLQRTVGVHGLIAPNKFTVALSPSDSERFSQDVQRFFGSALVPQRLRQQREAPRQGNLCSSRLDSRQALSDLRDFLCFALLLC